MLEIDRWAVDRCDAIVAECLEAYGVYDFTRVFRSVHGFCDHDMSAFYLDAIKDRMYCDGKDWPERRSAQRACHEILVRITKLIAPITMHTAEETYGRIPAIERLASVHMDALSVSAPTIDAELASRVARMLEVRDTVSVAIESWKKQEGVKDTQDVDVILPCAAEDARVLESFGSDLATYFRVASIQLVPGSTEPPSFRTSELPKCERSRIRRADVEPVQWNGEVVPLSARDRRALGIS
jgi:isoleucyl-tRNA synthetase